MNRLWPVLLPELRQFPAAERDAALRAARATALDLVELIGMGGALVLVTWLTRYVVPDGAASTRLGLALLNFVVAAPLLVLTMGPLHLRRLRRGLKDRLQQRGQP
jgi:hypothetical protein